MKARIVKTTFYTDNKVESLSKDARWLFMYCLTNPYIGLTGCFEVTDRRICYETGLCNEELTIAKKELEATGLCAFIGSWVVVINTEKHNRYSLSDKTKVAYNKEFVRIPWEVKQKLSTISKQ